MSLRQNMEDFSYFTDNFLSNGGFQQLYSVEDDEEICLWDTKVNYENSENFDTNNYLDYGFTIPNIAENVIDSSFVSNLSEVAPATCDIDRVAFQDSVHNLDMITFSQTYPDQGSTHTNDSFPFVDNDWELNIETLLLDNTLDTAAALTSELPDRTFFCNESCNIFLRESSLNLTSNLQTFLPEPNNATPSDASGNNYKQPGALTKSKACSDYMAIEGDKTFVCTFNNCGKVYAKAGHLKAHIRRHVGEKPYVCLWPNCTWKFSRSDELSRHRRSHSGELVMMMIHSNTLAVRHNQDHSLLHSRR